MSTLHEHLPFLLSIYSIWCHRTEDLRHRHSAPGVADGFGSSDVGPASAVIIILYLVKEIYEKMKGVILISSLSIKNVLPSVFHYFKHIFELFKVSKQANRRTPRIFW